MFNDIFYFSAADVEHSIALYLAVSVANYIEALVCVFENFSNKATLSPAGRRGIK